jgi:hypothetical protein
MLTKENVMLTLTLNLIQGIQGIQHPVGCSIHPTKGWALKRVQGDVWLFSVTYGCSA